MKQLNLLKLPFVPFLVGSLALSFVHFWVQRSWIEIQYRHFGPRPPSAQAFIGSEVILLMLILGMGFSHICDKDRDGGGAIYYLGIAGSIGAWVLVSFIL